MGGKFVLGFGVVWWSIATVLTPIAAKLGLPFLLVVRAFMGIGEVSDALDRQLSHKLILFEMQIGLYLVMIYCKIMW